jgi:hypothetical protein
MPVASSVSLLIQISSLTTFTFYAVNTFETNFFFRASNLEPNLLGHEAN